MQTKKPTTTARATSQANKPTQKAALKHSYEEPTGPISATYIITKGAGVTFMLAQSNVTIYDNEKDTVRSIRYCPNEPSIFVDEQSTNAVRSPVIFREGRLFVPKEQPNLKKFLDLHPMNTANGGTTFSLENIKKKKEESLSNEFLLIDAVNLVKNKDIDDLIPVAIFFKVNTDVSASDLRFDLLRIAKSKPRQFIDAFDDPSVQVRAMINKAADYNIISIRESGCHWFDSGSMIVSVPVGQDPVDVLTRFCLTEKGATVLEEIEKQLP